MVIIPNIDGHIWNLEYIVPDLIHEYQTQGKLNIYLHGNGGVSLKIKDK